jgi:outer membrane autotransporter protein
MGSSDRQRTLSGGLHAAYVPDQGPQLMAGGLYSHIDAKIERGYHNGNTPVTSVGETDGTGLGAVARFGWAARPLPAVRVMPFADYEITHVRYQAYTETTGPFPAAFNTIDDTQQRTRLGGEARYSFNPASYVWGSAAWGHRLTGTSAPISGTLTGLFGLSVPGSAVTRDWVEATAGLRVAVIEAAVVTISVGARFADSGSTVTNVRTGVSFKF